MSANPFDISLASLDLRAVIAKRIDFVGLAKDITAATPTPFDDILVAQFADVLYEYVLSFLPTKAPQAFESVPTTEEAISALANKVGLTLNPAIIAVLLQLAWPVVERLIKRWAGK
jgi:hypothetical protein